MHRILDKIDRTVARKRLSGELEAWISNGSAQRYCKRMAARQSIHYPALLLYLERHAGQA